MSINIYTVANHLSEQGWTLISDKYQNLNTELEMQCPKGHKQLMSYGTWRKNQLCPICLGSTPFLGQKDKVPPKSDDTRRILALDAATNISGYAVYDDKTLVSYGTFKTNATLTTEARINSVKKWLINIIKEWEIDFVGIEAIQLQMQNGAHMSVEVYRTLANLQGVLLDATFEASIDHELVYPSAWRKLCGISDGDSHRVNKKKQAQEKVYEWYCLDCTQDEADAICIGKYFCHYLKGQRATWGEKLG